MERGCDADIGERGGGAAEGEVEAGGAVGAGGFALGVRTSTVKARITVWSAAVAVSGSRERRVSPLMAVLAAAVPPRRTVTS